MIYQKMEITITKGKNRNSLTCKRKDGSFSTINLGPNVPDHDLAHFVVEQEFNLKMGFFGNIKSGKTIQELSDPEIILSLPAETWLSEILARNLQSLASGAVKVEEFSQIIEWEAQNIKNLKTPKITLEEVIKMKTQFDNLCKQWDLIGLNEKIKLEF